MADILAENLSGKAVTGSDGAELGMLYNITMNIKSGELKHLLVDPGEGNRRSVEFDRDEGGRYKVPVDRVQAVKDQIIVRR